MPRSKWLYRLSFASPVSVFSGLSVAGLVDRMVMRTVDGLPYIPGSTVKGRWRFTAERLLRTNGSNPSFKGQGLFCHGENQP